MQKVYLELLKIAIPLADTNTNLENSLWIWGNYDFIKATCNEDEQEPIAWYKKQYEECHVSKHDKVEHQPVFLYGNNGGIISDLCVLQNSDTDKRNQPQTVSIYVLSLLQLDYLLKDVKSKNEISEFLSDIENKIKGAYSNDDNFDVQAFLNLGESDVALLFRTNKVCNIIRALQNFSDSFPVIKTYSLIIFPIKYEEIKSEEEENGNSGSTYPWDTWFEKPSGGIYDIRTSYVTDRYNRDISNQKNVSLLFGDYDAQKIMSSQEVITDNHINSITKYRYSKSTPIFSEEAFIHSASISTDAENYEGAVNTLSSAFDDVYNILTTQSKSCEYNSTVHPDYYTILNNFESAKKSFINLQNYFIRLHETRFAPDVYIHIRSIFAELTNALKYLKKYIENETNKNEYILNNGSYADLALVEANDNIFYLLERLQQFLGIVSLSPRAFSEVQGSYMRSANASLKLVCAYHSAVNFMYEATKCRIDGTTDENSDVGYERSNCAVLILPTRDAETVNKSIFEHLTPEHHISIIEVNFMSMFDVKFMLFTLAHEVGHFAGNRKRAERNMLFTKTSLIHTLYYEMFYDDMLERPLTTLFTRIQQLLPESDKECFISNIKSDKQYNDSVQSFLNNLISLAEYIAKRMIEEENNYINNISPTDQTSYKLKEKYHYLNSYILYWGDYWDEFVEKNIIDNNDQEYSNIIKKLSETQIKITDAMINYCEKTYDHIIVSVAQAIAMKHNNTKEYIYQFTIDLRSITKDIISSKMDNISIIFEDVYADLLAIKILNISRDEYSDYILNAKAEIGYYIEQFFIIRFITVMSCCYNDDNNAIWCIITKKLPSQWLDIIKDVYDIIVEYRQIFLDPVIEYANLILSDPTWPISSKHNNLNLVRSFYSKPLSGLYEIWLKGLDRKTT